MSKKYLSWSLEATYLDGKKVKKDNLTVDFGLDKNLVEAIEKKLDEIAKENEIRDDQEVIPNKHKPIEWEFCCNDCGREFIVIESDPNEFCSKCGSGRTEQVRITKWS